MIGLARVEALSDSVVVVESRSLAVARWLAALALGCGCSSQPPSGVTAPAGGGGAVLGSESGAGKSASGGAAGGRGGAAGSGGNAGGDGAMPTGDAGEGGSAAGVEAGAGGRSNAAPTFALGVDISSSQEATDSGVTYVDTDGKTKELLPLLGAHGFNYVRLRTFVDPSALYGYANPTGEAQFRKAESYCDTPHTLELARQVKQARMGFLLDLHYSDNWADPGKQVIPAAWRGATSIDELASSVQTYTTGVVRALVDGGARPDMVQIGNEITPGLLIHVPSADPQPDQWGNINKVTNTVNGSTASFDNVAKLLKAGAAGVRAVDPSIKVMVHVENTQSFPAVRDWVKAVRSRGVELDVLGLSCYTAFQGEPAIWQDTFQQLAESFADISFVIAEYGPEPTSANEIIAALPGGRGLGTFLWEPTQSGTWGESLFTYVDGAQVAKPGAFAEFDALKTKLGP